MSWREVFRESVPVLFGYLPLGAACGIVFSTLGFPWYYSTLASVVVFAGAAQFLLVSLMSARAGWLEVFTTTLILNLRHVFYGFSLLGRYRGAPAKAYLIFGLTDETYSVITAHPHRGSGDRAFCTQLTFLHQLYWVVGCTLGAIAGSLVHFNTQGFEFVLLALFTVLMIEQAFAVKRVWPFAIGWAASVGALLVYPEQFLFVAMAFAASALALASLGRVGHA